MRYQPRPGIILIALFASFLGCQAPPKKPVAQKVEAPKRYTGPAAARQPKQRPAELNLEPTAVTTSGQAGPSTRALEQRLDLALKEKADAEQTAEALRKDLDAERAAHASDQKALEEARARLAELQAQKPKAEHAAPRDEDTYQKLLDLGRGLYDKNDLATARRLLQGLADLGYENGAMFFMLGRSCQEMEDWEGALSNYGKACDTFQNVEPKPPTYSHALVNMGVILRSQRRYTDAEEAYRRATKADPKYPNPYYNLGLLYEECLKDTPKALAAYERYIDLRGERYQDVQDRVKRLREMIKPQGK